MGGNVLIQGKLVSDRTKVKEILVDGSGAIVTIPTEHSKVHQGRFFGADFYDAAVVDTGTAELLIQTAADKSLHLYIKLNCGGDALFEMYEGTTVSAAGTSITPVNHNRISTEVCTCTITHTPTITDDGTQIWKEYVPGGAGGGGGQHTPGGMGIASAEQFVLAPDTIYLLRLTNNAGSTQPMQIITAYYSVDV